jgi:hypothetical protein
MQQARIKTTVSGHGGFAAGRDGGGGGGEKDQHPTSAEALALLVAIDMQEAFKAATDGAVDCAKVCISEKKLSFFYRFRCRYTYIHTTTPEDAVLLLAIPSHPIPSQPNPTQAFAEKNPMKLQMQPPTSKIVIWLLICIHMPPLICLCRFVVFLHTYTLNPHMLPPPPLPNSKTSTKRFTKGPSS